MPKYRPSELRSYLDALGASPKKGLSQNFLIDGNILKKIVQLAKLCENDTVIEIGSGPGALTELILQTGCSAIAIEKDTLLAKGLEKSYFGNTCLKVLNQDVLEIDFANELRAFSSKKPAKIVANIPYNITSMILHKVVMLPDMINMCVLMVQDEVARKCIAKPGSDEYGFLSVFLQFYSDPCYGFHVPAGCFYPRPKVGSSVIRLDIHKKYAIENEDFFMEALKEAFTHKRKMIKVSLKKYFDAELVEKMLIELGHAQTARPDELSCAEWVSLYQRIIPHRKVSSF